MKKSLGLLATLAICSFNANAAFCQAPSDGVTGKVEITAPAQAVWDAVHHERQSDPDLSYSKVVEQKGNRILLEQKFNSIPIVGEATCLLVQEETPLKRIDYKMVRSDKFKEMWGSWVIEENPNGVSLSLHSVLDTGLPYAQSVTNQFLKGKIDARLNRVKTAAEKLAQKPQ
ncbi:MAG TPA: hypothetical protein EYN91_27630 [Candidatus Melainabacteria bacterium]|jgi:hypothetical protein|nr:hypothetical protein [Candidatus Melainabacteria bacterium]HIN63709.1 hypothetical protein [Candidatus Obscuribacterales bacterium]